MDYSHRCREHDEALVRRFRQNADDQFGVIRTYPAQEIDLNRGAAAQNGLSEFFLSNALLSGGVKKCLATRTKSKHSVWGCQKEARHLT